MKRCIALSLLFLFLFIGLAFGATFTPALNLTKPTRGDTGWAATINDNFDKLDAAYSGVLASTDDLPYTERFTGTFNGATGTAHTLGRSVDATNEYTIKVTPLARTAAIGDVYVTKTTTNFTVHCSGGNTADGYEATVYYQGDVVSYGGSMYRRWYPSPDSGITDHSVTATTGSLAFVLDAMGGASGVVELPGNRTYVISAGNVTIPVGVVLKLQPGAVISLSSGRVLTINGGFEAGLGQCFSGSGSVVFANGAVDKVFAEWWGANGSSDQTAINEAIGSLTVGVVQLLGKDYRITDHIALPNDDIELRGANQHYLHSGGTRIYNDATDGSPAIWVGDVTEPYPSAITDNVNHLYGGPPITNIKIVGNASSGDGIRIYNASVAVSGVMVSENGGYGIYANKVWSSTFTRVVSQQNSSGGGILINYDTHIKFESCAFLTHASTYGFDVQGGNGSSSNIVFDNCDFEGNDTGLHIDTSTGAINGLSVRDCNFESNITYDVQQSASGNLDNLSIRGGVFNADLSFGIIRNSSFYSPYLLNADVSATTPTNLSIYFPGVFGTTAINDGRVIYSSNGTPSESYPDGSLALWESTTYPYGASLRVKGEWQDIKTHSYDTQTLTGVGASHSVDLDGGETNNFKVAINDATLAALTISIVDDGQKDGDSLRVRIYNGVAASGTITFDNSIFAVTGSVSIPTQYKSTTLNFAKDGAYWHEVGRAEDSGF